MPDINCENTIIDNLLVKSKLDRAKYALASKKRQDFIWHTTKDMIAEPYEELCDISSWRRLLRNSPFHRTKGDISFRLLMKTLTVHFLMLTKRFKKLLFTVLP